LQQTGNNTYSTTLTSDRQDIISFSKKKNNLKEFYQQWNKIAGLPGRTVAKSEG